MQNTFSCQGDMRCQYMCTALSEAPTALRRWACHFVGNELAQGKQPFRASLSVYVQSASAKLHHRARAFTPRKTAVPLKGRFLESGLCSAYCSRARLCSAMAVVAAAFSPAPRPSALPVGRLGIFDGSLLSSDYIFHRGGLLHRCCWILGRSSPRRNTVGI